MRLSTKRMDQIFNISITVQQNIQGKLTRINYFKLASQGEIMIVLHLQKVTHSLSDEVSFFSDFEAFKSFLFMSRAFRKASCALQSSVRSAYRGEVQRYDENDDQVFVFYFKDRAVYSLNATGAFADGIIRPSENL